MFESRIVFGRVACPKHGQDHGLICEAQTLAGHEIGISQGLGPLALADSNKAATATLFYPDAPMSHHSQRVEAQIDGGTGEARGVVRFLWYR